MAAAGRSKDRVIGAGVPSQREKRARYNLGQQHLAALVTLAEDAELHPAAVALDDIRPGQGDELGDAEASGIANLDEDAIAARGSSPHKEAHLYLRDDALRDAARLAMHSDHGAGVEWKVADAVAMESSDFTLSTIWRELEGASSAVIASSAWRTSSTVARRIGAPSAAKKRSAVVLKLMRLCSDLRLAIQDATSCSSLVADVAVRLAMAIGAGSLGVSSLMCNLRWALFGSKSLPIIV